MAAIHHPPIYEIVRHGSRPGPMLEGVDPSLLKLASKDAAKQGIHLGEFAAEMFTEGYRNHLIQDELSQPPATPAE